MPGGGAQAVYTAGVCRALCDMDAPLPDIIVASSGSCGTAFYYAARQWNVFETIWCDILSSKRFANPLRFWKLGDIDYLVDDVCKKQSPLDMDAVYVSPIVIHVAVTNARTGAIKFFSNKDDVDLWEVMRATKSSAVFAGLFKAKTVIIGKNHYFDTRLSSRAGASIYHAIACGANKVIVLDSYHPKNSILDGETVSQLWLYTRSKQFRMQQTKTREALQRFIIPSDVVILYLSPKKPLSIAAWNNSRKKLLHSFEQGYQETKHNKDIISFIHL